MKQIAYIVVILSALLACGEKRESFFGLEGSSYRKPLVEIDSLADHYPAYARVFLNRADSNENVAYYKLISTKIAVNQKLYSEDYYDLIKESAKLYESTHDTISLIRALYYQAMIGLEYFQDTTLAKNLYRQAETLNNEYSGTRLNRHIALVYDKFCKLGYTEYNDKLRQISSVVGDSSLLARSLVYEAIETGNTDLADQAFRILETSSNDDPGMTIGMLCNEYVEALIDKGVPDSIIMRFLPRANTLTPVGYTTMGQYLYNHSHPDYVRHMVEDYGLLFIEIGPRKIPWYVYPYTYSLLSNFYYVALKDGNRSLADSIQRELRSIEYVFEKEENSRQEKEVGLTYEGGNTRFQFLKAQTYVMYGIIAVLLLLLALAWWHLYRIRRANRMIGSLNASVHQLKDVENPALSERCEALGHEIDNQLRRLKRRESDIANYKQEIDHLENISRGLMVYSQILQNKNISQIGRQGINQFLDSFRLIDEGYSQYLSELDINPTERLLCILYHIGKTDDDVMQILQYTLANIRVRKSRIKADTGVQSFDDLITKQP